MAVPDAGHGGGTPSSGLGSMPLHGWRLAVVVVLGLVFSIGPLLFSSYWVGLLTQMVILAILAMSLDILLGYTGLPSFGHRTEERIIGVLLSLVDPTLDITGC